MEDLTELFREVDRAGPTFTVRRTLQRLERDEIGPRAATRIIRGAIVSRGHPEHRGRYEEDSDSRPRSARGHLATDQDARPFGQNWKRQRARDSNLRW